MSLTVEEKKNSKKSLSSVLISDPETLRKESDSRARKIEQEISSAALSALRNPKTPARELNELIRSFSTARLSAYPDSTESNLSLTVPAKLLKPIEQAILAQRKTVDRAKPSKRLDVHYQDVSKPTATQANSDSESVQFGTSDKVSSGNLVDSAKSSKESTT